ncbi:MAG: epoxyqueuosine reductase QueH [Chloroflexi bacterium]|nr:epoxyqueuosine reductase QueH [Chloroflexota bacterium]
MLVHACCGPCSTYTIDRLRHEKFDTYAFWYNPNVHPYLEHQRRFKAMQILSNNIDLPLITSPVYDIIEYFRGVSGQEGTRCQFCYLIRLSATAATAREKGFDAFTTTLLISPYQKHDLLIETAQKISSQYKINFYYEDFRKGYSESRRMAKELGLYRQPYCGCIYSEWERYKERPATNLK